MSATSRAGTPALSLATGQSSVSYSVNTLIPDIDYILECSADLQTWAQVDAYPMTLVGSQQTRTYPIPTGSTCMFYRLRTTQK